MSSFRSYSDDESSDYGYNLSPEEENLLCAIADRLSPAPTSPPPAVPTKVPTPALRIPVPRTSRPPTSPPKPNKPPTAPFYTQNAPIPEVVSVFRPPTVPSASTQNKPRPSQLVKPRWDIASNTRPDASQAVEEALDGLGENDLNFDITQLTPDTEPTTYGHGSANIKPVGRKDRRSQADKKSQTVPGAPRSSDTHVSFNIKSDSTHRTAVGTLSDVSYPDLSQALAGVSDPSLSVSDEDAQTQLRKEVKRRNGIVPSPLVQFRSFPKKPLSVTDLTAGLWCELQHYYTLSRLPFGRKTQTAAMKKGSKVHEKLEREVFQPVTVTIAKKVDNFGLQMWNVILGLRTLRDTGSTRELQVWGMVDGNLVNGVIDYLSYENPDSELEEETLSSRGSQTTASQRLADSLLQVYITDIKTRLTPKPPSKPQVHMSLIQLFLYHRFLSEMASDKLDYFQIFSRYGLDPQDPFSDSFMAQMGALHEEVFENEDSETETEGTSEWGYESAGVSTTTATTTKTTASSTYFSAPASPPGQAQLVQPKALKYRNLQSLLGLLKFELQLTFPHGASDIGQIVAVEYRFRGKQALAAEDDDSDQEETDKDEGRVISTTTYFVEPDTLDLYLAQTMPWWKGEREPRGVEMEDAFKCGYCEFAGECEWRAKMDDEVVRKARASKARRERKRMKEEGAVIVGEGLEGEQGQKPVLEEYSGDVEEDSSQRKTPKRTTKGKKRGGEESAKKSRSRKRQSGSGDAIIW
ncbi:exonuclease V [Triangularia verruculosa]|uniref:Exonuclease V n=1 Tax=Triangularia verruculosa TaxID=2587418 RepID=A0AAN7AVX3_9PEZI|nr:exonuclease V [Triangularia verruculosa]